MTQEPLNSFVLSQTDGRPMYLQIMEQIKHLVAIANWPAGHKLPSIREMAVSAKVSVITVKRAYQELESEGVIVTLHGKGSFISKIDSLSDRLKEQEMDEYLQKALAIASSLDMSIEELHSKLLQHHASKTLNNESE